MYDKQKTNSSGSCPLGRCYKTTGAYHYRCSQNAWCKPESWMNMQQKLTLWEAEQHLPKNVIPFPSVRSEEAAALQM